MLVPATRGETAAALWATRLPKMVLILRTTLVMFPPQLLLDQSLPTHPQKHFDHRNVLISTVCHEYKSHEFCLCGVDVSGQRIFL